MAAAILKLDKDLFETNISDKRVKELDEYIEKRYRLSEGLLKSIIENIDKMPPEKQYENFRTIAKYFKGRFGTKTILGIIRK